MMLRNHGTLAVGASVADAFQTIYFLERACAIQVAAQSGGAALNIPADDVQALVTRQVSSFGDIADRLLWPAMLRKLDRIDPGYRSSPSRWTTPPQSLTRPTAVICMVWVTPPSTARHWAVMKRDSSLARKTAALATSQASPTMPSGATLRLFLEGCLVEKARHVRGDDMTRADRVRTHTLPSVLDRHLARESDHPCLGRTVGIRTAARQQRRGGRDIDDGAIRRGDQRQIACLVMSTQLFRFASISASHRASSSRARSSPPLTPTLFTRTSSRPNRATVAVTMAQWRCR